MDPAPRTDGVTRRRGLMRLADRLQTALRDRVEGLYDSRLVWVGLYFAVLVPLLLTPHLRTPGPLPAAGEVARADVVAPETLEYVDEEATRALREAARAAVLPVYELDTRAAARAVDAVRGGFEAWRRARGAAPGSSPAARLARLRQASELPVSNATLRYLEEQGFDARIEERLAGTLREVLGRRVVAGMALLPGAGPAMLRDARTGREWREEAPGAVLTLDDARRLAEDLLTRAEPGSRARGALAPLLRDLIAPTLTYNAALTEARRQDAAERLEPLWVRVPKGKTLLRAGEVVREDIARRLRAWNEAREEHVAARPLVGNLLLAALLLFFMSRYVFFYQQAHRPTRHLFALMVTVIALSLLLDRGFLWLYERVVDTVRLEPFSNPEFYRYMVPMAAGAMLTTLLVNPRVGMAYALFYVPLFGMTMDWDLRLLLVCLVGNLAGIYGISAYRQRTAPIKAGLLLGGVNAVAILALEYVLGSNLPATHLAFQMACGFGGGILVAILVSFLLPVLESAFNILTDVRLLELSNLNNPLLRRLAVEAPGSYNHSIIVGTLAEAAAEAIGANALFCRVAAYYHDVGKLLKPSYFIENQRDGLNRHDRLSPHMSALVIASHVKEGYELAKSHGLPKQVLDIIPQHHGTRKINYFYQKAVQEGDAAGEVMESDFRYPGPRPQTREAAVFMLSDSIEAAARTLEDPSPARFKGMIRTIVSDVVLDDQFGECDLTFADLERASAAFLKTLTSIYHHRIDYPGFDFDKTPERPFRGSRTHAALPPRARKWGR
jgi:hypothetical protein